MSRNPEPEQRSRRQVVRKVRGALLSGVSAAVIVLVLNGVGAWQRMEWVTWDMRIRATAHPSAMTPNIHVILIDQYSLDWMKGKMGLSWPWPREMYSPILKFIERGGAKAVAFDMIFTEPSYMGASDDAALGEAIANTTGFTAGVFLSGDDSKECKSWPEGGRRPAWGGEMARTLPSVAGGWRSASASFPIPDVSTNAFTFGDISGTPDADGLFRGAQIFRIFDGTPVWSLGLAAWQAGEDAEERPPVDIRRTKDALWVGTRAIPLDPRGCAVLRFRGPSGTHPSVNAAAVIQSEMALESGEGKPSLDPAIFKDGYVFLGASAAGLMDLRPSPVSRVYPGVEIHATALDNFLAGDFVKPLPLPWELFFSGSVALLTAFLVVLSRRVWASGAWIAAVSCSIAAGGVAGAWAGWWIPIVMPLAGAWLAGGGGLLYNYATEGRQKAFVKQAFRQYLGQEVINQILLDPDRLKLGGEKRELTIYFSDIEKFSSFSERLDPPALTALLNDYLTEMGRIIMEEGGYLDKFIGDAIVAFWNAPVPQPDHALRALRAALRCQARLAECRAAWEAKYGAVIRTRIGLNTGEVTVGNMGSVDRFNYTVLGDAANLASRLEGANKAFGSFILASESAWRPAEAAGFMGRELGQLRVVGRKSAVRVFEPYGAPGTPPRANAEAFASALAKAQAGRFAEAEAAFRACAEQDAVASAWAARCRDYLQKPPESWDGVLNLSEK